MSRLIPRGLRAKALAAILGVAIFTLALAAFVSNGLVDTEVNTVQLVHARDDAKEAAALAESLYAADGELTPRSLDVLQRSIRAGDGTLSVLDERRRVIAGPDVPAESADGGVEGMEAVPVSVDGRRVATIVVRPAFAPDGLNVAIRERVEEAVVRVNLLIVVAALAGALALAVVVSASLTRPLRALTDSLERAESSGSREPITVPDGTREVTALTAAYNRLLRTLARQERARREAAASAAHELRTPVSGIVSRLEAMEDGILPMDQDNIGAVLKEAERLKRLVEDVDKLYDAEHPRQPLRREPVQLEMLVARRVAAVTGTFAARKIALSGSFRPVVVDGDATRLEQVVDNLVSNALRYTDDGGKVDVLVGRHDGHALVEVIDDGLGIAAEDLPRVFEPFWRAETSRARVTGGAGLGLAVARELVVAHGGRVTIESARGEGTAVRISLPVTDDD